MGSRVTPPRSFTRPGLNNNNKGNGHLLGNGGVKSGSAMRRNAVTEGGRLGPCVQWNNTQSTEVLGLWHWPQFNVTAPTRPSHSGSYAWLVTEYTKVPTQVRWVPNTYWVFPGVQCSPMPGSARHPAHVNGSGGWETGGLAMGQGWEIPRPRRAGRVCGVSRNNRGVFAGFRPVLRLRSKAPQLFIQHPPLQAFVHNGTGSPPTLGSGWVTEVAGQWSPWYTTRNAKSFSEYV